MLRSKTHKRLKERFLIGRHRTKRAIFRGSPLFQTTYNQETEKQTINSIYPVSVGCGRLAEGKRRETDSWEDLRYTSHSLLLVLLFCCT